MARERPFSERANGYERSIRSARLGAFPQPRRLGRGVSFCRRSPLTLMMFIMVRMVMFVGRWGGVVFWVRSRLATYETFKESRHSRF